MWRVTLKGILAQRLRLALTGLAIVIGVAFVSGTFVFTDTMNKAFDNLFAGIYANTDVVVQGSDAIGNEARPPFDEALLETVRRVEGVEVAAGTVAGTAQLIQADGDALRTGGGPAQGFSWDEDDTILNPMTITEGRPPATADEAVVEKQTADRGDFTVGQTARIIVPAGTKAYRIVGIAELGEGGDSFAGATTVFFTRAESQRAFQKEGKLDQISAAAEGDLSEEELRDRIAAALPADLDVQTGTDVQDEQSQDIKDQLSFLTTFLLVFGFIAVFVAAFIIFNTFSITVAQRARQLALLRAVGASGAQVTRMVVGEAVVVGLFASVLGMALGFLVAKGVQALFESFGASLPTTTLQLEPRTVIVALLVGVLVTVVAALIPAVRAARLPPVAALREDFVITQGSRRRRLILGGIVTVIGGTLIGIALTREGTQEIFTFLGAGALVTFVGLSMLAPLVAGPVARVLGAPLARFAGVPGTLGRGNAMRNPQRTAQTATALMIGLALVTFVTVFAVSLSVSFGKEIDRQLKADIIVYDETTFFGFPTAAADAARTAPLVDQVTSVRGGLVRINGDSQTISGTDPALAENAYDPQFAVGSWADLAPGTILLQEDFAAERDLVVGDTLEMQVPLGGVQRLDVSGIYTAVNVGPAMITLSDFERWFPTQLDFLLFITGRQGADPAELQVQVADALEPYPSITVRNQAEYKQFIEDQVNSFLGLVYALLALAVIIAIFGIVNTLALSVFERTREIGLLRAVGLSSRQARRMVRYEAVIVALLGGLLGVVVGVVFGIVTVSAVEEIGTLAIPWGRIVIFFVLAGLAGVLAAVWPARRAARLDILKAVTHE
jgi:putative ABC transport system permease protein